MTAKSPIEFVPPAAEPGRAPRGGFLSLLGAVFHPALRVLGLDALTRAEDRALSALDGWFSYAGHDIPAEAEWCREHYRDRLRAEGLDPALYRDRIEWRVQDDFRRTFGLGMYGFPAPAPPAPPPAPTPGTPEHKRAEATATWEATGIYGLPSYGGHILTKEERRQLGIFHHAAGD